MYFIPLLFAPFILMVGAFAILAFILWLWMLIDCLQRRFKDKLLWVLVIIFAGIIGAILYYFLVKTKGRQKVKKKRKKKR